VADRLAHEVHLWMATKFKESFDTSEKANQTLSIGAKDMASSAVFHDNPISAMAVPSIRNTHRPRLSAMFILAADSATLGLLLWGFVDHFSAGNGKIVGWQVLPLFLLLYRLFDLYPGVSVSPVDEIRRVSLANTSGFLFVSVMLTLAGAPLHSLFACAGAGFAASVLVPTIRSAVRHAGSRTSWWGFPVVLFGGGEITLSVVRKLKSQPNLGLRPLAIVADRVPEWITEDLTVYQSGDLHTILASGVRHAIVVSPEVPQSQLSDVLEHGNAFSNVTVIPNSNFVGKVGSYTQDLMGVVGVQVRNDLVNAGSLLAKRAIDVTISGALLISLLPVIAVVWLLVALESGRPVFYSQKRVGRDGRAFHIWKFRTMVDNAAEILAHHLANNPDLRKEWEENQKLRNDPRVTRIGKLLRKTSLDELPQLWNVLKGEMSLVGPRPIVHDEVAKYKEAYSLYAKAIPGITGLWQVSGRNRTTYAERIAYDSYYVRNWSVWMDVYLLAKTVTVVLTGYGAY
jgi:Undecaprenyl-phosphate galactose phosphotransferase WbaP